MSRRHLLRKDVDRRAELHVHRPDCSTGILVVRQDVEDMEQSRTEQMTTAIISKRAMND